jgi:hypothetical protein
MKKTRGKKKKVSSSPKKIKRFFLFNNKVTPIALIVALLTLAVLLIFFNNSTGNSISGRGVDAVFSLTGSPPQFVLSITDFLNLGSTWKEIIISLVVLVIIFAGVFDILELTSLFNNSWVLYVISGGLAVIACLTEGVYNIVNFALRFAAGAGAIGVAVEIVIAIAMFIGLSFGSNFIARWAAKRKGQKEYIKAITSSDEAGAAIKGLRHIQKEFKRKE